MYIAIEIIHQYIQGKECFLLIPLSYTVIAYSEDKTSIETWLDEQGYIKHDNGTYEKNNDNYIHTVNVLAINEPMAIITPF